MSTSHSYERDQVVKIINSVMKRLSSPNGNPKSALLEELKGLKAIIEATKSELGAARPHEIKDKAIPEATDELDAVVEATAEASGMIMDQCDIIQSHTANLEGQAADDINNAVTKIFEACSFQDITGQRITKVIKTLREIDSKVEALISLFGGPAQGSDNNEKSDERTGDDALLNGPQLPDKVITQDDIDKLLAEFDE